MNKRGSTGIALFFIALLFLLLVIMAVYNYYVDYQYEQKIGSYMDNAADMVAPEGMLAQIASAKQGMIDAGLTDNDYGAMFFKKPTNSMKFQYQHIDAITERINAVIDWKNKVYNNQSSSAETLGDVYETKMTNLRNYINEGGRSDWVAKDAWLVKNHALVWLVFPIIYTLGVIMIIVTLFIIFV